MASNIRQNRTLEAYCCLRGLENEVTSDFCLAPTPLVFKVNAALPLIRQSNSF